MAKRWRSPSTERRRSVAADSARTSAESDARRSSSAHAPAPRTAERSSASYPSRHSASTTISVLVSSSTVRSATETAEPNPPTPMSPARRRLRAATSRHCRPRRIAAAVVAGAGIEAIAPTATSVEVESEDDVEDRRGRVSRRLRARAPPVRDRWKAPRTAPEGAEAPEESDIRTASGLSRPPTRRASREVEESPSRRRDVADALGTTLGGSVFA